jgi:hypothetical protein
MPQFYFHLWRGGQLSPDEVGVALPNLKAAKHRAERMAASLLNQNARDPNETVPMDLFGWDIEIMDAAGCAVLVVPVDPGDLDTKPDRAA